MSITSIIAGIPPIAWLAIGIFIVLISYNAIFRLVVVLFKLIVAVAAIICICKLMGVFIGFNPLTYLMGLVY